MRVILFDIDGTLIDSGGAGTRSLNLTFKEHFEIENAFAGVSMAGKTDIEIMKTALARYEISNVDGILPRLLGSYLKHLSREVHNPRRYMKPGVKAVMEALSEKDDIKLGLLTGNLEGGARIKLSPFDLNQYFPIGAFGSDNEDRNKLLPIALKKFESACGIALNYSDFIVVGDTPRDVLCVKPYGALCIAVATGPYPMDALKTTDADLILKDISDVDGFINFIL